VSQCKTQKKKTNVRFNITIDNVAGVLLPLFYVKGLGEQEDDMMIEMTVGGYTMNKTKDRF
jgi:vacuolar-type H+-ATPase subunit D/Vma8